MENNNPTQQPPAPQTPIAPEPSSGDSNKMVIWLIVGLVIIIVIVGGIYFFLSSRQAATNTGTTQQPVVQVTPQPPDTVDALEKDLNTLNVESADSEFTSIDQDLQQL